MHQILVSGLTTLGQNMDPLTFSHSVRVSLLAQEMALVLGLTDEDRRMFALACCFHDVGKLRIPHEILSNDRPLSASERDQLQYHPVIGVELVRRLGWRDPRMQAIVRSHHERWDGTGYPDGLKGECIPPWARICTVIDSFDAMTQPRLYNRVKSVREAREELVRHRDSQFDGFYVDQFLKIPDKTIQSIRNIQ